MYLSLPSTEHPGHTFRTETEPCDDRRQHRHRELQDVCAVLPQTSKQHMALVLYVEEDRRARS